MAEASSKADGNPVVAAILGQGRALLQRKELLVALIMVLVLVTLILPIPRGFLDFALAFSITFSVLILMIALFVERPLEFTSFPTVLLFATLTRLALNLASTRLILSDGHLGTQAAGRVIEAFGGFVMGGNFVIGIIIFGILVIVNFVVITKGSGRIAEVSARFTLDALPGKQMAIDADLAAGLIEEADARERRQNLQEEASYFGAMDGAAKFVRGDAVAGLLITFINVLGGIFIGVFQKDMGFAEAADAYTRLTVGDGLVSQIPALIVSTAAGLVVTKAGLSEAADVAMFRQMSSPKALGMSSALLVALSLVPGIPFFPFITLAGLAGGLAYSVHKATVTEEAEQEAKEEATSGEKPPESEESVASAMKIDTLRLELGYGLLSLISSPVHGQRLTDQIRALRRQMALDMGFIMPSVRIQDNMQLSANEYAIRVKEIEAGRGEVRPAMLLVMDPRGEEIGLPGENTVEPTFGLPAMWVEDSHREEALFRGYTVVDPSTVVTTHLTEVVKDYMSELLSFVETNKLLDELDKAHQKLVSDIVPNHMTISGIQRVLQNLLSERVSIRDLSTILEGISEACVYTRNILQVTEHVRGRLARQISEMCADENGVVLLVTLSAEWEEAFSEALIGDGDDRLLSMPPSKLQEFVAAVRHAFERSAMQGEAPALLTSPGLRPYVRTVLERFRPATPVVSQSEIHPKARIKTVGQI